MLYRKTIIVRNINVIPSILVQSGYAPVLLSEILIAVKRQATKIRLKIITYADFYQGIYNCRFGVISNNFQ